MNKWKVVWTKSLFVGLFVAFILVAIDFASKWVVQSLIPLGTSVTVIPNFFYLTKSYNIAVAFSLGESWGVWGRVLNIAISVVMSFAIFAYYLTHESKLKPLEKVTAVLLGAGAVGNLIDRAFYWEATTGFNGVIDFLQFYLAGGPNAPKGFFNPFATFNFADACLVIGIVLLIVALIVDAIVNRDTSASSDPRLVALKQQSKEPKAEEKPVEEPTEEPKPLEEPQEGKEGE